VVSTNRSTFSCDIARPVSPADLAKNNTTTVVVAKPVKATHARDSRWRGGELDFGIDTGDTGSVPPDDVTGSGRDAWVRDFMAALLADFNEWPGRDDIVIDEMWDEGQDLVALVRLESRPERRFEFRAGLPDAPTGDPRRHACDAVIFLEEELQPGYLMARDLAPGDLARKTPYSTLRLV
jgi:hypothetical protein